MMAASRVTDSIGVMAILADNPYLRDAVMTATPEQLQLMLYDGAIRFATQGRDAVLAKDYETSYLRLTRAQNIVMEMQNGLRHDVNPELCRRMASIYGFVYNKLVDGCVKRDVHEIDDALKVLRIERETWQMLVEKLKRVRDGVEPDGPPAGAPAADGPPAAFSAQA